MWLVTILESASFQNPTGDVLYDVVILSEKSPLPSGYTYAKEFLDLSESPWLFGSFYSGLF